MYGLHAKQGLGMITLPTMQCSFQTQILQKNCRCQQDSNLDRRIEGEHADHLTTTTALF